jgi:hypothetical protein
LSRRRCAPIVSSSTPGLVLELPGFNLGGLQWVAVELDVTEPATITRIDAWMLVFREGSFDLSLYSDGGEVPGECSFRVPDSPTVVGPRSGADSRH